MSLEHSPQRQKHTGPRASFSINEFVARHGLSRSYWYTMQRLGIGPDTMDLNGMKRITPEAEQRWMHEREAASA
jgi:hypothetical protein